MVRFLVPLLIAAPLFAASAGQAQNDAILSPVLPSVDAAPKTHAASSAHKTAAAHPSAKPDSEAEKAARLAEGRKKFFEKSMGFDNGEQSNFTITNDGGVAPAMGLKF